MYQNVARDISYAHCAETKGGRALIRLIENSTGRLRLIKRARGYEKDVALGRNFFEVMTSRYGLSIDFRNGDLASIPKDGPLIVIANHPYGILDGLILGHMLQNTRHDFRILANSVFQKAHDVNQIVLPISFDRDKEGVALNIATRKRSLAHLAESGAIAVFPGGTVSTAAKPFSKPLDPGWRSFTARLIAKSNATVLPVFFHGHTSRLFQIASHLHMTLRLGLLINEFGKRTDTPVSISIGAPIGPEVLEPFATDSKAMMDFLRKATYDLSPNPKEHRDFGFEFEKWHRR